MVWPGTCPTWQGEGGTFWESDVQWSQEQGSNAGCPGLAWLSPSSEKGVHYCTETLMPSQFTGDIGRSWMAGVSWIPRATMGLRWEELTAPGAAAVTKEARSSASSQNVLPQKASLVQWAALASAL